MNDIVKLAVSVYKGNIPAKFTEQKDPNEVLREQLVQAAGGDPKLGLQSIRFVKPQFFAIIEETLNELISEGITTQLQDFAEVKNVGWNEKVRFHVPDNDLFEVSRSSGNHKDFRRQRINGRYFEVDTEARSIAVYEELYNFLAGNVDWVNMVNRVAESYVQDMRTNVYQAIYDTYSALIAPFKGEIAGTSNNFAELQNMANHVKAASNGANVVIYGTNTALGKLEPAIQNNVVMVSDRMKEKYNDTGHYGMFRGFELREIAQAHKPGTFDWAIDDDFLLVIPEPKDKFVKIVREGTPFVDETGGLARMDLQKEYKFWVHDGISIVASKKYGICHLSI